MSNRPHVSQRRYVAIGEAQALDVAHGVLKASAYPVGPVGREAPYEEAEGCLSRPAALPVGLGHRELVEVGEEGG